MSFFRDRKKGAVEDPYAKQLQMNDIYKAKGVTGDKLTDMLLQKSKVNTQIARDLSANPTQKKPEEASGKR